MTPNTLEGYLELRSRAYKKVFIYEDEYGWAIEHSDKHEEEYYWYQVLRYIYLYKWLGERIISKYGEQ